MTAKIYRFPTAHVAVREYISAHDYDPYCTCSWCVRESFKRLEEDGLLLGYDLTSIVPEIGDD